MSNSLSVCANPHYCCTDGCGDGIHMAVAVAAVRRCDPAGRGYRLSPLPLEFNYFSLTSANDNARKQFIG